MTRVRIAPLWQRNLVGALVAAAALAVSVSVTLWPLWTSYRVTVHPAHVVAAHQSFTIDGQNWAVSDTSRLHRKAGSAAPLPDGTVLMEVTVERSGAIPADFRCNGILTDGERRWRTIGPTCVDPGPMTWTFLIPDDAVPTALDVTMPAGAILIRLLL